MEIILIFLAIGLLFYPEELGKTFGKIKQGYEKVINEDKE